MQQILRNCHLNEKFSSGFKLKELDQTFRELNWLAENIVEGNLGPLRDRLKYKLAPIYPMLERIMIRMKNSINRRLSPRMSKLHPWEVCFDIAMPSEVFDLLYKEIISRTRYGIEVDEHANSVTITFKNLRRLCHIFVKFEDCQEFKKQLGDGNGHVQLIVSSEKEGTLKYRVKDEILKVNLHYGYWNSFGISNIMVEISQWNMAIQKRRKQTNVKLWIFQL